jgi:hypothetical protein
MPASARGTLVWAPARPSTHSQMSAGPISSFLTHCVVCAAGVLTGNHASCSAACGKRPAGGSGSIRPPSGSVVVTLQRKVALALTFIPRRSPPGDAFASRLFVTLSQATAGDRVRASGSREPVSFGLGADGAERGEVRDWADSCLLQARRSDPGLKGGDRNSPVYQGLLKITTTAGSLRSRLHLNAIASAAQWTRMRAAGRTSFLCVVSAAPHVDGEA